MADLGNAKVSLSDPTQLRIFTDRITKITRAQSRLSNFDANFLSDIQNLYSSFGTKMKLTRKQMNYLGEIVASLGE